MPNGGVPLNMLLQPKASDTHVVYSYGCELRVIRKEEWERAGRWGQPDLILDHRETQVLERFLRYWLHDSGDGPLYREEDVNADFDF